MKNLEKYIDHTLLKADATSSDVISLCHEAIEYGFHSVCVNSSFVYIAYKELKYTPIQITAVCGFPLGSMSTDAKVYEAKSSCENGADEIDMVIHIGKLKEKDYKYVKNDIYSVASVVHAHNCILKVIIETCLLSEDEKIKACKLSVDAGADFVKTSTGFNKGGATISDVMLIKTAVNQQCMIKASGGIRDTQTALSMIEAGADRLGVSSSIQIVNKKEP